LRFRHGKQGPIDPARIKHEYRSPFDFAQESPAEACPEPAEWGLCFDSLSTNELANKSGRINSPVAAGMQAVSARIRL